MAGTTETRREITLSRRSFLKWSAAMAGSAALVGCMPDGKSATG